MAEQQHKGLLETLTWKQARSYVDSVRPDLAQIIDELDPGDDYQLIRCVYPFGSKVLSNGKLMLPCNTGDVTVPIDSPEIDPKLQEAIGYNLNSNPVSLVIRNSFEIYIPLDDKSVLPLARPMRPGALFGAYRVLNPGSSYQPVFTWDMTAGARSMFMLPKITEVKKHQRLKKQFNLTVDRPTTLMSHWEIFKELAAHESFTQPWSAEIIFFTKKWFEKLDDPRWVHFDSYFRRLVGSGSELSRNQTVWQLIFSLMLKDYEGRPSAYICDTVKNLMHIGAGAHPGLAPAVDNVAGPIQGIQEIYRDHYNIRNYPPIIMCPAQFDLYTPVSAPVYYSLNFPTAVEFGKSSRTRTSLIDDLHQIRSLLIRYRANILSNKFHTEGTPMHDLFHYAQYDFFHNNVELHTGVCNSQEMREDENLRTTLDAQVSDHFPDMCSFVKGCIRISHQSSG